jgi:hypothetical protein
LPRSWPLSRYRYKVEAVGGRRKELGFRAPVFKRPSYVSNNGKPRFEHNQVAKALGQKCLACHVEG